MADQLPTAQTIINVVPHMSARDLGLPWLKSACRSVQIDENGSRARLYQRLLAWIHSRAADAPERPEHAEEAAAVDEEGREPPGTNMEDRGTDVEHEEVTTEETTDRMGGLGQGRRRTADLRTEEEEEGQDTDPPRPRRRQRVNNNADDLADVLGIQQATLDRLQELHSRVEAVAAKTDSAISAPNQQLEETVRDLVLKERTRYPEFHFDLPHLKTEYDRIKLLDTQVRGLTGLSADKLEKAVGSMKKEIQRWGAEIVLEQDAGPAAAAHFRASYEGSFLEDIAPKMAEARKRACRGGAVPLTAHTTPMEPRFRQLVRGVSSQRPVGVCWTCLQPGHTKNNCPDAQPDYTERNSGPRRGPTRAQPARGGLTANNRPGLSTAASSGGASH